MTRPGGAMHVSTEHRQQGVRDTSAAPLLRERRQGQKRDAGELVASTAQSVNGDKGDPARAGTGPRGRVGGGHGFPSPRPCRRGGDLRHDPWPTCRNSKLIWPRLCMANSSERRNTGECWRTLWDLSRVGAKRGGRRLPQRPRHALASIETYLRVNNEH